MIDQTPVDIFRYRSLCLNRGLVVLEIVPAGELRRGETQIETPSETLMDIMRMQRSHKTSSDSPIHERDKNIISYRNARERESTYRDYQIVELAPPGYPLVGF